MKVPVQILLISFLLAGINTNAQSDSTWKNWEPLMGKWKTEINGTPGEGKGSFTFNTSLDKNILERHSHTVYPATGDKPETMHDDLLIIYKDFSGHPFKAIQFDNEGHTIRYDIKYKPGNIIFTSEWVTGMPVFRLTYTLLDDGMLNTRFEISKDGIAFQIYMEEKSKKVK